MEFGNRRNMCINNFIPNQNMLFNGKGQMNQFHTAMDVGAPSVILDNIFSVFDLSSKVSAIPSLKAPPKRSDNFARKMPICDPVSASFLVVGGFVGSKSQAGSSCRGSEFYSVWDVIRNFLPSEISKDHSSESSHLHQGQFGSVAKWSVKKNISKPVKPFTVNSMGKSYAEVAKSGIISDLCKRQSEREGELKLQTISPQAQMTSAIISTLKPILNSVTSSIEELNSKDYCTSNHRLNSFSSDSDCTESLPHPMLKKIRNLSECSVDSDDSFIVFENNDEDSEFEESDSSEDSSDENDEVDCCPKTSSLSVEIVSPLPSPYLAKVNSEWNKNYNEIESDPPKKLFKKKVTFAKDKELAKVQMIVVWDFAYRSARKGPWEELARDSARFRERIQRAEVVLGPILHPAHRRKVLEVRFPT